MEDAKGCWTLWMGFRLRLLRLPKALQITVLLFVLFLFLVLILLGDTSPEDFGAPSSSSAVEPLLAWILKEGGHLHECVAVQQCGSGGGRCVMATCSLRADELLVSIPASVQLFPTAAGRGDPCPQLDGWLAASEADGGAKEWNLDSDAMRLTLRLLEERERGDSSPWKLYMPTIPSSFSSVLWDWDVQRRCLKGTPGEVRAPRRFSRRDAERRLLRRCRREAKPAKDTADEHLFWAMHAVGSRSYEKDGGSSESRHVGFMVPFADMFNDSPWPNAAWSWHASGAFQIKAAVDIDAGSEVYISYGEKTNDQLMTRYGFVHTNNTRDVVFVNLVDHAATSSANARLALSFGNSRRGHLSYLPRAFAWLRSEVQTDEGSRTPEALEEAALSTILRQCEAAGKRWLGDDMYEGPDGVCAAYRKDLVNLASECVKFAKEALAEVFSKSDGAKSTYLVEGGNSVAEAMLDAWRKDVAGKLPALNTGRNK